MDNGFYQYDLFISYCTQDQKIAMYVCNKLENIGLHCFIAPRNIRTGEDYAKEIVNAISNSCATLLIFSSSSDKSGYVLREINSAVSRNKTIIPLRIESFLPSEAMEFYLGPTHWLDAFPAVLDSHITSIKDVLLGIKSSLSKDKKETKAIKYEGPVILEMDDVLKLGYSFEQICMREIDLDYISVPTDKYNMNDEIEGTFDEWLETVKNDEDKSLFLIKEDKIVGYCDLYIVDKKSFDELAEGKRIIRDDMLPFYMLGGSFDLYFPLISLDIDYSNEKYCLMFLKKSFEKILKWQENGIQLERVGISIYSSLTEKIFKALGFEYSSTNPAGGKVYITTMEKLQVNPISKKLFLEISKEK